MSASQPALSEPDHPADQDDVDPAGQFLVDLEDLPDVAVLTVGGSGARVFELEAVLEDPLPCRVEGRDELLRADAKDHIRGTAGKPSKLTDGGRVNNDSSLPGPRVNATERVIGLARDRLHLLP